MSRVLVPLDEAALGEAILPEAEQLAGPGGEILLVEVAGRRDDAGDIQRYLADEAELLSQRGVHTTTKVLSGGNISRAIDEGVSELGAEFVAAATEVTGDRLGRGSLAWNAVAHSPVPVLLRCIKYIRSLDDPLPHPVKIMVPLDGSEHAEKALPVAAKLAAQWHGSILLTEITADESEARVYLDNVLAQSNLSVPTSTAVRGGRTAEALARLAIEEGVTHVVMSSHGRTGLSRVIAGDVAGDLINDLPLPIVVVPVLTADARKRSE